KSIDPSLLRAIRPTRKSKQLLCWGLEVLEGPGGGRDDGLVQSTLDGVLGLEHRALGADLDLDGEADITDTVRRRRNPRTWIPDLRDREGPSSRGIRNPGSGILPRQRHP